MKSLYSPLRLQGTVFSGGLLPMLVWSGDGAGWWQGVDRAARWVAKACSMLKHFQLWDFLFVPCRLTKLPGLCWSAFWHPPVQGGRCR